MPVEQLQYEWSGVVVTPAEGTTLLTLVTASGEPIRYADPDHIEVLKSGDGFQTASTQLYRPRDWEFSYVDGSIIELVTPVASGETFILRRVTPLESLMEFNDGALLTAEELERLRLINLYRDQELHDYDLQLAQDIDDVANGIDPTPPPEPPDEILPEQASQMLLQLAGNPVVGPTSSETVDPLNAMFTLYVDPHRGQDDFVTGSYASFDDGTFDTKMLRMEQQRLRCGYTEAAPFRTINRAVIEAAIITSKSWMTLGGNPCGDLVSIVLLPGIHEVLNGPGTGGGTVWQDEQRPSNAELQHFNAAEGGIVLPRGCSLCGMDLRKVNLRPTFVPTFEARADDWSNQIGILRTTGGGYYFGFTFLDRDQYAVSHHLLSAFKTASEAELDTFYAKILGAFGPPENTGNLRSEIVRPRPSEYQIVGPLPPGGGQDETTDTVQSSSPYIFNCSLRSVYGMGGCLNDGSLTAGFDSVVMAQFTGVSLQKDLRCWDRYDGTTDSWIADGSGFATYSEYIQQDPNNVRYRKGYESAHIVARSDAFIQEVSVFAIGQSYHHLALDGGEITITNSNSTFGGAAAVAQGYQAAPEPLDTRWTLARIKVPYDISESRGNIEQTIVGTIASINGTTYVLETPLEPSDDDVTQPKLLTDKGYSFRPGSFVWIENPNGLDWRATVSAGAWGGIDTLTFDTAPVDQNGDAPGFKSDGTTPAEIGRNIYIRRIVDTRSPEERRCSMILTNTDTRVRRVPRDYVAQLTIGPGVDSDIPVEQTLVVTSSAPSVEGLGALWEQELTVRRATTPAGGKDWVSGAFYRAGDKANYQNKHWACVKQNDDVVFDPSKWSETHVWLEETAVVEDFFSNEFPILIYDNDTDGTSESVDLGYDWTTAYTADAELQKQYDSAADVLGVSQYLEVIGFNAAERRELLKPRPRADRLRDPSDNSDMLGYSPAGGAVTGLANWPMEFRRPSIVRMFGHAWEWAGFGNYTKALPDYQRELTPQNLFSYYFGVQTGGRVYGTGFNEQGFQVTQAGLVDLSTGKRISVENVGSIDVSLDEQTVFDNATLNNPTIKGSLDMGDVSNVNWPTAANAMEDRAGIAELASSEEVRTVFLDPLADVPQSDSGASRVVPLQSLRGLKAAILTEVQLLETRFRYLYVDGSISRSSADQPADVRDGTGLYDPTLIPDAIWTDIKRYRQLHQVTDTPWTSQRPNRAQDAEVFELASEVCFPTLNMATEYLSSRNVVDNSDINILCYGSSQSTGPVIYKGTSKLGIVKGPAQPPSLAGDATAGKAPTIYMAGNNFRFGRDTEVGFRRVDINITGTIANPDKDDANAPWPVRAERGGNSVVGFYNSNITYNVTRDTWIRIVEAEAINVHQGVPGLDTTDEATTQHKSLCNFNISTKFTNPGQGRQGRYQLFTARDISINCGRRTTAGATSERELIVNLTQNAENSRPIDLFKSSDGRISLRHQQNNDPNNRNYTGGWYRFNISGGGSTGIEFFGHAGIGSDTQGCGVRVIQTSIDNIIEGGSGVDNPLYDAMFDISVSNSASAWVNYRAFSVGTGLWANFGLNFANPDGLWRKFCRALVAGTTATGLTVRDDHRITALQLYGGGNIGNNLRVNPAFYPLDTTTLEEKIWDDNNPIFMSRGGPLSFIDEESDTGVVYFIEDEEGVDPDEPQYSEAEPAQIYPNP